MSPSDIYTAILRYAGGEITIICNLHSACNPSKGHKYMCSIAGSKHPVIDFDAVKIKNDIEAGIESRKSVDALALSESKGVFCFIELKSWDLLLKNKGTEKKVRRQAGKYSSDLPQKLSESISICQGIVGDVNAFDGCRMIYILVTDISVDQDGIGAIYSDLTALAGTSSNLNKLCNQLSWDIMRTIPNIETRYWECRKFDNEISHL